MSYTFKYWFKVMLWIVIPVSLFYIYDQWEKWDSKQPKPRAIVYACPEDESVKCYRLEADTSNDCDQVDEGSNYCWTTINTIYFPNGGYIDFDSCDTERNNKYTCTAVEINDGTWKIEYTGEKTLKKYPQPIGLKQ